MVSLLFVRNIKFQPLTRLDAKLGVGDHKRNVDAARLGKLPPPYFIMASHDIHRHGSDTT